LVTTARDLKEEAARDAVGERDDNLRYDEVWCVFDVDEHPRISEARQMPDWAPTEGEIAGLFEPTPRAFRAMRGESG